MCNRYVAISKMPEIKAKFELDSDVVKLQDYCNPNISVGDTAPVLVAGHAKFVTMMRFGLRWNGWQEVTNLRSEGERNQDDDVRYTGLMGIVNGPYRPLVLRQRCAVIADAFIVGEDSASPYLVYPRDRQRPFLLAGVYDQGSFALLTIFGNRLSEKVGQKRSPVVLSGKDVKSWLSQDNVSLGVGKMLKPLRYEQFNAYPISREIAESGNKKLSLLHPVGYKIFEETQEREARERDEWLVQKRADKRIKEREKQEEYQRHIQKLKDKGLIS